MFYRMKKTQVILASALLTVYSGYALSQIPTIDVEGSEKKTQKDFCIYSGQIYSIGSVVDMSDFKKECRESMNIPPKNPAWEVSGNHVGTDDK